MLIPPRTDLAPAVHARWAAASAVLLLREYADELDALCAVLRAGGSVGECCVCIDESIDARRGSSSSIGLSTRPLDIVGGGVPPTTC